MLSNIEMVAGLGEGLEAHATTLQCAVLGYANRDALKAVRAKIMPTPLQLPKQKPPKRSGRASFGRGFKYVLNYSKLNPSNHFLFCNIY